MNRALTLPKPLLRGWLHLVCFFLAIPAGVLVVALAASLRGRIGASVYAVGLIALFGVSGMYHRGNWSERGRALMQRLDHGTIFVMIAGSYTPLCLLVLHGWVAAAMLVVAWTGAVAGFVLSFAGRGRGTRIARSALYIVLGWISVVAGPQLLSGLSLSQLVLIVVGGVLFTIGAIFLATNWPDPFPRVFGYHEVWHVLVVAAVVCHFVAISSVVAAPHADLTMPDDVERWAATGIYDPAAPDAEDRLRLLRYSAEHGISDDELVRRSAEGSVSRAVVDRFLSVERRYTLADAAGRTGLSPEVLVRVWLALGFSPPADDEPVFNDADLELIGAFHFVLDLFGLDAGLQFTRVMGSSIARIVDAAVSAFLMNVEGPLMSEGAGPYDRAVASAVSAEAALALPDFFGGLYRRHFELAVERSRATQDTTSFGTFHLTVGFCDLVGYTQWSRHLSPADLGAAVNAFEQEAHELITTAGSRLIKSVGDAVLFITPAPETAAAIALDLTEFVAGHPALTALRSGLATGEVLGRDGDYYGSVVNLAARMVKETDAGTVVSDRPIDGFASRPIGAVDLRGVGEATELFVIDRRR